MVFCVVDQCLMARRPRTRTPSARGLPSTQAPCEIRARVHAERDPIVLPRKPVDAPRARYQ
eukprot:9192596-Alexandrium_andersonii.AAC.1